VKFGRSFRMIICRHVQDVIEMRVRVLRPASQRRISPTTAKLSINFPIHRANNQYNFDSILRRQVVIRYKPLH